MPFGFETVPQETIAALFLEAPKGQSIQCLSHEAHQRKDWRKRPYFHHAVEIKQPCFMKPPCSKSRNYLYLVLFLNKIQ